MKTVMGRQVESRPRSSDSSPVTYTLGLEEGTSNGQYLQESEAEGLLQSHTLNTSLICPSAGPDR